MKDDNLKLLTNTMKLPNVDRVSGDNVDNIREMMIAMMVVHRDCYDGVA